MFIYKQVRREHILDLFLNCSQQLIITQLYVLSKWKMRKIETYIFENIINANLVTRRNLVNPSAKCIREVNILISFTKKH